MWGSRELIIRRSGPAGTGKTREDCEWSHLVCEKYPGTRIIWFRKYRADMAESVLATFEEFVIPPNHPIRDGRKRSHRTSYDYPNGSKILIKGWDDPERTKSYECNAAIFFEASQFPIEEECMMILRALRWPKGLSYKRVVFETNPTYPQHWLMQKVLRGEMVAFDSTFHDNAAYWDEDAQEWTPRGKEHIGNLERLTGVQRARLLEGKWVADEGAVFDLDILLDHRNNHGAEPVRTGTLSIAGDSIEAQDIAILRKDPKWVLWRDEEDKSRLGLPGCEWKLWCDLVKHRDGTLRPSPNLQPVLAADISFGVGASNSVISVGDYLTRRKIAEFACAGVAPFQLARILAAASIWFGGMRGPATIIWEANGPGSNMGALLTELQMPRLYRRTRTDTGYADTMDSLGWWSTADAKLAAAMKLKKAYADHTFINPSKAALDETMTWIVYEKVGIGPAKLVDEGSNARATHGDRTIADMLLVEAFEHEVERQIELGDLEYERFGKRFEE